MNRKDSGEGNQQIPNRKWAYFSWQPNDACMCARVAACALRTITTQKNQETIYAGNEHSAIFTNYQIGYQREHYGRREKRQEEMEEKDSSNKELFLM